MARVKRAVNAQKKRRSTLEAASGYRGQRSRLYRKAKEQLLHSATYQYRDRKDRKGDFRQLWITRINAAARANDMTYNRFIQGLRLAGVEVDRKVLADLAVNDAPAFAALVEVARGQRSQPRASAARPPSPRLPDLLSSNNARLAAARRLTRRSARREAGRFLAEGAQAVREALAASAVLELFATAEAIARHPSLTSSADEISPKDAAALSETVTPQGLVAVCRLSQPTFAVLLDRSPRLVVVLVEPNEPGNVGAIIRTADAAGADAVVLDGGVDAYNGKAVRASAGSLFHLPVIEESAGPVLAASGLTTLATSGAGSADLDELISDGTLNRPVAWLFGSEAHGLPATVLDAADRSVRVPIYGRAESLNLAAAAAVCLYASARAQRS